MSGTWILQSGKARQRASLAVWLICMITMLGAWFLTGCTSDIPSEVGTSLVHSEIDVVLEPLSLNDLELYTAKNVSDDEVPLLEQEVLYFGSQEGNSSSILVNYDFSDIYSEEFPDTAWTLDHITNVELRLVRLAAFGGVLPGEEPGDDDVIIEKYYMVHELDEPFNGANFPGPIPAHGILNLNTEYGTNLAAAEPRMVFTTSRLLNWIAAAEVQGLIVNDGPESSVGMLGFASNDLDVAHAGELANIHEDPGAYPVILVSFDHTESIAYIDPMADISTFHEIKPAPLDSADGMMLRTCLRTYPMLRFDFSSLPENVFINRAILSVTNNVTTSFGQLEAIVVSEIDVELFGVPGDSMPLANLDGATYNISGMTSLDPYTHEKMDFVVTSAIQRIINDVYEGDRGFILTAGEDIYPVYNLTGVGPDFYFNQFDFFGTSAADTLRPKLKITYSSIDDLSGGGK